MTENDNKTLDINALLIKHIDTGFADLKETMSRVGNITDGNAKDVAKLQKDSEYLSKEITEERATAKQSVRNTKEETDRIYDAISGRVTTKAAFWFVGIQTTVLLAGIPILLWLFTK